MRIARLFSVLLALFIVPMASAHAAVVARVDISNQTMDVYVDGAHMYSWPVSTARKGYHTPRGSFRPQGMAVMHYSAKYDNSPMPHSIFFTGGFAIHGTEYVRHLGRPASHGCVRLSPSNAATLFSLVRQHGTGDTRIVISD